MVDSDILDSAHPYAPRMTPPRRAAAFAGLVVLVALTPSALVAVPASAAPSATTTAAAPPTYHLRASGRTVHVKRGHLIRISLPTASDGGYRWLVVRGKHSSTFTIVSRKVVAPPATTQDGVPSVGGYSRTVYTLRGRARGHATFKAIERRPFDKSDVIHRFTLHLHVTR
jgi:predicted secreted protein